MKIITQIKIKYRNFPMAGKATFWFLICNFLQKGLSVISVPIFTRIMSTEEYGMYSAYLSWFSVFSIFTTLKLDYGVFNKGITKFKDKKDTYMSTMIYITSFLSCIYFIVDIFIKAPLSRLTELSPLILFVMGIELLSSSIISFWSLRERYDFRYRSVVIVTMLVAVLNTFLGICFVFYCQDKAQARILSSVFVNTIFGFFVLLYIIKEKHFRFDKTIAKFAITFNLPLIPHYLSEYVLDQSDRIMIQKMCSRGEIGLYSVVYNAGMVLRILISSLNSSLIPWLYQHMDKKMFHEIKTKIQSILVLLSIPLLIFIFLAPEFLKILAAPQYLSAVYIIPPVTASIYYIFLFGIYGNIEFFWEKNKFTMYASIFSALINIGLNLIFIPLIGYIAAAYTTLISYMVLTFLHALFVESVSRKTISSDILNEKYIWKWTTIFTLFSIIIGISYKKTIVRFCLFFLFAIIILLHKKKLGTLFHSILVKENPEIE